MFNKLRAKILSLKFKFIRRTVIIIFSRWPKDLERAITIGDSLNHILMISPLRYFLKFKIPKNIHTKLTTCLFHRP